MKKIALNVYEYEELDDSVKEFALKNFRREIKKSPLLRENISEAVSTQLEYTNFKISKYYWNICSPRRVRMQIVGKFDKECAIAWLKLLNILDPKRIDKEEFDDFISGIKHTQKLVDIFNLHPNMRFEIKGNDDSAYQGKAIKYFIEETEIDVNTIKDPEIKNVINDEIDFLNRHVFIICEKSNNIVNDKLNRLYRKNTTEEDIKKFKIQFLSDGTPINFLSDIG